MSSVIDLVLIAQCNHSFIHSLHCTMKHKKNSWICLLGGLEEDLIRSKHVAITKSTIFVYK